MTGTAPAIPASTDPPDSTIQRAVVIPDWLWPRFVHWCGRHRIALHERPHSPAQMPRFDASRSGVPSVPSPDRQADLSDRELEVLALMAEGLTNPEIARKLLLADETIKTHVRRILYKLGARDRCAAVATALRRRLLN